MSEIALPHVPGKPPAGSFLHRLQAALALVIALAAIGLAFWEGIENRRHNRLTVKPRLAAEIETGRNSAERFAVMAIEGTGLGPAVIETFRIYFDGVPLGGDGSSGSLWQKVLDAVDSATQVNAHSLGEGYYFPAGRRYVVFEARRLRSEGEAGGLADVLDRLAVQICYCSVYGTDCEEVLLSTSSFKPETCRR